mmetsp:Transcript_44705/g.49890  ORF Transcript_44705/g.49890 Transcript_44705/m.49890 type:complete len:352 (-) Transcript_44705:121-1176(-)|eukprot:CAMPEP_0170852706 /NCGR_PEP_ID=MMETSP0734-20130129/12052_1 /TAXON_ID=186038 /ORGANISM="Fragilariopsis kerguelensis, Strain L26-C5" /LENGTH=351 /DNA_ID=CAMNT_0011223195 /DNA_START=73 /DNA_END=1128 /DNA_ORIENTATION=+
MTLPNGQPKKYIPEGGKLVLNPAYREWKNQQHSASMVTAVAIPIADNYYFEEEGAEEICVADAELRPPNYGLGSSQVIKDKYTVPKGVAVEMIKNFNGKKDLLKDCPSEVWDLLHSKSAFDIYDKFVQTIYDDKHTRNALGRWKDAEFVSKVDLFRDDFAEHGIKVALCIRNSKDFTSVRWLEFIDVEEVGNYVPQFDLGNMSGQYIRTAHTKLQFPNGVAVEELKQWGGRDKLKEKLPYEVEKLLKKHNLMDEYHELVSDFVKLACGGKTSLKNWDIDKLKMLVDKYDETFGEKGIDLYVSHKQEYISHGASGGHTEHYRWIEFVDRNEQPNYIPQRNAHEHDELACSIM